MENQNAIESRENDFGAAQRQNEREISIVDVLQACFRYWWIVVLAVAICAVGGYFGGKFFIKPNYRATAKMQICITSVESSGDYYLLTTLKPTIVNDSIEFLKTTAVAGRAAVSLNASGKTDYQARDLISRISVSSKKESMTFYMMVDDADAETAYRIAQTYANIFSDDFEVQYPLFYVNVMEVSEAVNTSVSPSKVAVLSAIAGLILSVVGICLAVFLDNKVTTPDDVEKYLNCPVLATIPYVSQLGEAEKAARAERKKKKKNGKKSR